MLEIVVNILVAMSDKPGILMLKCKIIYKRYLLGLNSHARPRRLIRGHFGCRVCDPADLRVARE